MEYKNYFTTTFKEIFIIFNNKKMATTYTFPLTSFPNNMVNSDNLTSAIHASTIVTALSFISSDGTNVYIVFKGPLSGDDQSCLAGLITTTSSAPTGAAPLTVQVAQENGTTNGKFRCSAYNIQGLTGGGAVTTTDFSWPIPISAMQISLITTADNQGDSIQLWGLQANEGYGEGVVGSITADIVAGATGIPVQSTLVPNVYTGDYLYLNDGTNYDTLGIIVAIDSVNNILYVQTPTVHAFAAATPTLIILYRYIIDPFPIGPPGTYILGDGILTGSYVSPNQIFRVGYTNNGTTGKNLYAIFQRLE